MLGLLVAGVGIIGIIACTLIAYDKRRTERLWLLFKEKKLEGKVAWRTEPMYSPSDLMLLIWLTLFVALLPIAVMLT